MVNTSHYNSPNRKETHCPNGGPPVLNSAVKWRMCIQSQKWQYIESAKTVRLKHSPKRYRTRRGHQTAPSTLRWPVILGIMNSLRLEVIGLIMSVSSFCPTEPKIITSERNASLISQVCAHNHPLPFDHHN